MAFKRTLVGAVSCIVSRIKAVYKVPSHISAGQLNNPACATLIIRSDVLMASHCQFLDWSFASQPMNRPQIIQYRLFDFGPSPKTFYDRGILLVRLARKEGNTKRLVKVLQVLGIGLQSCSDCGVIEDLSELLCALWIQIAEVRVQSLGLFEERWSMKDTRADCQEMNQTTLRANVEAYSNIQLAYHMILRLSN